MQGNHDLTVRPAAKADIPFLARMEIEASLPPFGASFWDGMLKDCGAGTQDFLEAALRARALSWGHVDDFIVLDVNGVPAAACAVFKPDAEAAHGPFNLNRLWRVSALLSWTKETAQTFENAYRNMWGNGLACLEPQAERIIETVAVDAPFRGRGLGSTLIRSAIDVARTQGARSVGIMVIHGNTAAQTLYEKFFDPFATFHAAYFNHEIPGLTKYRATLSA